MAMPRLGSCGYGDEAYWTIRCWRSEDVVAARILGVSWTLTIDSAEPVKLSEEEARWYLREINTMSNRIRTFVERRGYSLEDTAQWENSFLQELPWEKRLYYVARRLRLIH